MNTTQILGAFTAYMGVGTFAWMVYGGTAASCIILAILTLAMAVSTVASAVLTVGGQR